MKTILIFSNPFGYGPAGKALSIANYIIHSNPSINVYVCGGDQLQSINDRNIPFISVDERDEEKIVKLLKKIKGEKYIISSQNRFAIKAANKCSIPCVFLDGLAWFWKKIPADHLTASIIFWINYPKIKSRIPKKHQQRIHLIEGISEIQIPNQLITKNSKILFYIGGCKNPLTNLPVNYLNLINLLIMSLSNKKGIEIVCDRSSREYLRKNKLPLFKLSKTYSHAKFIKKLSQNRCVITNGGQTVLQESSIHTTPIKFFLPINLSQLTLIRKVTRGNHTMSLNWEMYFGKKVNFSKLSEKEAINFFDNLSKSIIEDKDKLTKLKKDFKNLLNSDGILMNENKYFSKIGSTGSSQIYTILKDKWGI